MQNIPTLRLGYSHGLLSRLASSLRPASEAELLNVPNASELFKSSTPPTNPSGRARDVLRHAQLLGLTARESAGWELTPLGRRYVEGIDHRDQWGITAEQRQLLGASLIERASRGDEFVADVALALSLATSERDVRPEALARAMAAIRQSAWEADNTFESQGNRYAALLSDVGLRADDGSLTSNGRELLRTAEVPDHPPVSELTGNPTSGRWWWVNQNATYLEERDAGIMWAPLLNKAGRTQHHWETMDEVVEGDQIVHYRGGRIAAASRVSARAVPARKPIELDTDAWESDGRLVRTSYRELLQPIALPEIPEDWRRREGGPFNQHGGVNQGYLFELSQEFSDRLVRRFPQLLSGESGPPPPTPSVPAALQDIGAGFRSAVEASGLVMPTGPDRVRAFLAAAITKRFVILTGLSGSGKTQLALRLGEWFGRNGDTRRLLTVAVRPDWTGPEALFGYRDALREPKDGRDAWFVPRSLQFFLAARREPQMPYLMVLDEMNLAHVERYFSDFLSGIESREPILPNLVRGDDGEYRVVYGEADLVELPTNLFVVGTVNVDETTYMFSPKVLDRAFTMEIRTSSEELDPSLGRPHAATPAAPTFLKGLLQAAQRDDWHLGGVSAVVNDVGAALVRLHAALRLSGDEFGHRVFIESLRFTAIYEQLGSESSDAALDQIVMLKLLPRVHGSRKRVEPVLKRLLRFSHNPDVPPLEASLEDPAGLPRLPITAAKIERMLQTVVVDQFVSFTE